jgi:DNA-binding NarL/FixJ family response regulator
MRSSVLIADDHEEVLNLLTDLLAPEFDVVGTATDGAAMVSATLALNPDIVVADVEMHGLDGIAATGAVLRTKPAQLVVILTVHNEAGLIRRALEAGARGYVHKPCAGEDLILALHSILGGKTFVSPSCGFAP